MDDPDEAEALAHYNHHTGVYTFPSYDFGIGSMEQAVIVHESVHALVGIRYGTKRPVVVTRTENEAAAYVANALYLRYAVKLPISYWSMQIKADEIAGRIMNVKNAIVPERDANMLRTLITYDPTYFKHGVRFSTPN
jgi:membrane protease subunit (stomatin/prohibitin family)